MNNLIDEFYTNTKKYKYAVTFAGQDRNLVERFYREFSKTGANVFYDDENVIDLVGVDLYDYLRSVYKNSEYVICFYSGNYSKKAWCNVELSAVKERFFANNMINNFFIPIYLDDSVLDFFPKYYGYFDGTKFSPEQLAKLVCDMGADDFDSAKMSHNFHSDINGVAADIFENMSQWVQFYAKDKKLKVTVSRSLEANQLVIKQKFCVVHFEITLNYYGLNGVFIYIYNKECKNTSVNLRNAPSLYRLADIIIFVAADNNECFKVLNMGSAENMVSELTVQEINVKLIDALKRKLNGSCLCFS